MDVDVVGFRLLIERGGESVGGRKVEGRIDLATNTSIPCRAASCVHFVDSDAVGELLASHTFLERFERHGRWVATDRATDSSFTRKEGILKNIATQ